MMSDFKKDRKGNVILDSVLFLIVLFVMGIVGVLAYIAFDDISTDIDSDPDVSDMAKGNISALADRTPSTLDGVFALAFGLLWLLVLVSSFLIDSHPIFFIVTIVLLICLLIASGYMSNFYEEFSLDEEYSTAAAQFPITQYVLSHLMMFVLIIGGSIAIVLFGKNRFG